MKNRWSENSPTNCQEAFRTRRLTLSYYCEYSNAFIAQASGSQYSYGTSAFIKLTGHCPQLRAHSGHQRFLEYRG